jgi:DNA modification methylase
VSQVDGSTEDARRIEYMSLDSIDPATRNPKRHAGEQIQSSLARFGMAELPLLDERTGRLVAGHGRLTQLIEMRRTGQAPPRHVRVDPDTGEWLMPVQRGWASADDAAAEAYLVASNHLTTLGGWDRDELGDLLRGLDQVDHSLYLSTGFTDDQLAGLVGAGGFDTGSSDGAGGDHTGQEARDATTTSGPRPRLTGDDAIPDRPDAPITRTGDLWHLGPHRIVCGDTTDPETVARLFADVSGRRLPAATMLFADPPYGMGKEADGIANDNLYRAELDAFQQRWWAAWRKHWADNGCAYVWGNAPDLWRWWWTGGLSDDPDLMVRNEIVWDKGDVPGMRAPGSQCYATASERCLLVFRGRQFLDSGTVDTWWEGHEPLRAWFCAQRDIMGWTGTDMDRICGLNHMASHWTGRSQFVIISEGQYTKLRDAAAGKAFTPTYTELLGVLFPGLAERSREVRAERQRAMEKSRTWFDATHDAMTDVWRFARVKGEDRYGHATPKPVAMVERAILTSSRPADVIAVPFAGTGPEYIAADHLGRVAVGAEITPAYVDVVCRRFQAHTGIKPERQRPDGTREPVDFASG